MKNFFLICFIVMLLLQGCGESHLSADPDVVSSMNILVRRSRLSSVA